jgi:hypothetical protein
MERVVGACIEQIILAAANLDSDPTNEDLVVSLAASREVQAAGVARLSPIIGNSTAAER